VRSHNSVLSRDQSVSPDRDRIDDDSGLLEVHLVSGPDGCLARFIGDLIEDTRSVVWGVEEILRNDVRVVLDLSGITSFDSYGLEAALGLMDAVRSFGGALKFENGL
jgi:hypothetical protein